MTLTKYLGPLVSIVDNELKIDRLINKMSKNMRNSNAFIGTFSKIRKLELHLNKHIKTKHNCQ